MHLYAALVPPAQVLKDLDTAVDEAAVPVEELTGGQLREDAVPPVLERVRAEADELRLAMLGE